jgi:U2 small nuclear ribonucleoprotein A'
MTLTITPNYPTSPHKHPLHTQTISLRSASIPLIENTSILLDQLDSYDLTDNSITTLSNLGSTTRLQELLLSKNEIVTISPRLPLEVPNLQTLILDHNLLPTLASLQPLFQLTSLTFLSLHSNPCARHPLYRTFMIMSMPQLKVLDYRRVTRQEREKAERFKNSEACRKLKKVRENRAPVLSPFLSTRIKTNTNKPHQQPH